MKDKTYFNFSCKILISILVFTLNTFSQDDIDRINLAIEETSKLEDNKAIDALNKILHEFEKKNLKNDSLNAKIHHVIGRKYLNLSRTNPKSEIVHLAVKHTIKAIALNSRHNKSSSLANLSNSLLNIGILLSEIPLYEDIKISMKAFETCIKVSKNFYTKRFITSDAYGRLASMYLRNGDFQKALDFSIEGEKIAKSNRNQGIEICLDKKAEALRNLGRLDEAESVANELVYLLNDQKENFFYSNALVNLATLNFEKKNYKKMDQFFQKAISNYSSLSDNYGLAFAYGNQGYCHFKVCEYSVSLDFYKKALKFAETPSLRARVFDNIGALFLSQNMPREALENFHTALINYCGLIDSLDVNFIPNYLILKQGKDKDYLFEILGNKGCAAFKYYMIYSNENYLRLAINCFINSDKLVDLMRQEHTGTLSKYFWRNKTRSLYENAIETCYLLKDYEKAYYFMEKSRAVMLNDKLNELGAKQKLNETDQEKERKYQRKIIELNTKIETETKVTEKEKLNSQLFDLQEQQERFVKSLETKYPAYYQLKYNTQIGTLKQMQTYLKINFKDKNATMVSYFFGDSGSYAMVISPTKAEIKQFKYDVAQNQEFVNLLANNQGTKADFARILSMGSVIYQKLIKPLNIPKGHLVISQDGVFMPFEALSSSATGAQYLLKDYVISYTYSGQFLLKKATETKFWPNQSFVGFAPVEFKNQLNILKTSDVTLGNVAKNYWFSDTFTGKVATKANFLQQAKDHKIVQIFTHAFADSMDTEPKIYFADDALKISELNAEDQFNTQLLVLSACKTGVGKLAKGEGVLSLARGFSMLGIPATITSLWSVEDKNTYQLTELFYKYLNQGLSKDEALQKAKLEFLELHPNSGPTDWAGMVLVGQTSQLTSNTPAFLVLGVIFSFAIIAGGLYFSRNRKAS